MAAPSKKCVICGKQFRPRRRQITCGPECSNENSRARVKKWHLANPEKNRASFKKWRLANPEKHRASPKKWQPANPEKRRASAKKWHLANPEKRRASKIKSNNKSARCRAAIDLQRAIQKLTNLIEGASNAR